MKHLLTILLIYQNAPASELVWNYILPTFKKKIFFVIIGEEIDFKGLNKNTSLDKINNLLKNYRESEREREKGRIRNRDIKKERER